MNKVLIACPTSKRHDYCIEKWIKQFEKQTFQNFEILIVDTTPVGDNTFYVHLKTFETERIKVLRFPFDLENVKILTLMAQVREFIRQEFLKGDYTHLFFIDSDIFIPNCGINKLLETQKNCIGFLVHIGYPKKFPCVFKSGEVLIGKGLDLYSWKEIKEVKKTYKDKIFPCYATGLGCLLIERQVLEKVPFRFCPYYDNGEDLWFFAEANEKGFTFYCYLTRVKHLNTSWGAIGILQKYKQNLYFCIGPADAKEAEIIYR